MSPVRRLHPVLAAAAALPLAVVMLLSPAATPVAQAAEPAPANPEALPTVQIDGVVWDQEVVGNTVYAVGEFKNARPAGAAAGQNESPRSNALAYDITTGELKDWAPKTNGAINTVEASADGSTIYLGGRFTTLNDQQAWRVGAVSAADGTSKSLGASANGQVMDLEVSPDGSTLYMSGAFTQINKAERKRAAALNLTSQALTDFAPDIADYMVRSITVASDNSAVAVGGSFTSVEGSSSPGYGLAILETSGALRHINVNSVVSNAGRNAGIMNLKSDAKGLYGVAYSYNGGGGSIEGMFRMNWQTGALDFLADCQGDSYDVHPTADFVYISSHTHDCSNIGGFGDVTDRYYHGVVFTNKATGTVRFNNWRYPNHEGEPAPSVLQNFLPTFQLGNYTGTYQSTWTVEGNDQYIVYGGEFMAVNGTPQQGLARFSTSGNAGDPGGDGGNGGDDKDDNDDNGWDGWDGWGWGWNW